MINAVRSFIVVSFALIASLVPAHAAQPFYASIIGDSLTTGLFATHWSNTYVAQLERYWPANSYKSIGGPGSTAAPEGSPWGPSVLASVPQINPQSTLVIVEVGTNDLGGALSSNTKFWNDYGGLIEAIKKQAPNAAVHCLGPWHTASFDNGNGGTAAYYDQIIYARCNGHARDLTADFDKGSTRGPEGRATDWGPSDGFHPNDYGHSWIAYEASKIS